MRSFQQISDPLNRHNNNVTKGVEASPVERALEHAIARWFGRPITPIHKARIIALAAGDGRRVRKCLELVMKGADDGPSFGVTDGTGPTLPLPANNPAPAASAASSSNGMPSGLRPTVNPVFPDVLGLRIADQTAPRGAGAVDSTNRNGGGLSDSDRPASNVLSFQLSPTATAGAQVEISAVDVASALAVQGYTVPIDVVKKAIVGAIKAKRV